MGGSGAYDATVRNGTDERLEISVRVTDGDSTPVDTSLTLAPAETAELDPSENTFKQTSTYTVEVDAGGDRRDTTSTRPTIRSSSSHGAATSPSW